MVVMGASFNSKPGTSKVHGVDDEPHYAKSKARAHRHRWYSANCPATEGVNKQGLSMRVFELVLILYYYLAYFPGYLLSVAWSDVYALAMQQLKFLFLFATALPRFCLQQVLIRFYGCWMSRSYLDKEHVESLEFGPSISFGGGGMLYTYYLGVAHYIYKHYDTRNIKILASSGGCFSAIPLVMGLDPYEWCKSDWPRCVEHYASRTMGQYMDSCEFYRRLWDKYLPPNAHELAEGRLFLSITLFPSFENKVVSHFESREDLINCILASICLPLVFLRDFPHTKHGLAIDGGLSNDTPCIDRYTITVSVLNPSADLVPAEPFSVMDVVKTPQTVDETPQTVDECLAIASRGYKDAAACGLWKRPEWTNSLKIRSPRSLSNSSSSDETESSEAPPSPVHTKLAGGGGKAMKARGRGRRQAL
eukprot:g36976.t1